MEKLNVFGKRLLSLREERKLSMEEVATAIGITKSTLSKYEKGKNEPGMMIAKHLADFFKVSIDWLIGVTEEKNSVKNIDNLYLSLTENDKKEAVRYMLFLKSNQDDKQS